MVIFSIGGDSIIARTAGRPAKTGGHALPRVLDIVYHTHPGANCTKFGDPNSTIPDFHITWA